METQAGGAAISLYIEGDLAGTTSALATASVVNFAQMQMRAHDDDESTRAEHRVGRHSNSHR